MKRRIKINGIIMFCAFFSVILFPNIFFRNEKFTSFNVVAKIIGITFILLGQMLRASSRGFKSEYSGNGCSLIQGGPYSLVRNPMYLGILLIGLGIITLLFKWWVVGIFLFVFVVCYLSLIFKEEKNLRVLFPQDYPDYQQQVPRILPSMATILKKDIAEYLPLKLPWLKREIGSILAVLSIMLFFDLWQDTKTEGISAYVKEAIVLLVIIILFICLIVYLIKRTNSLGKNVSNKNKNTL